MKGLNASERLLQILQDGLPITERPYAAIAEQLGWTEQQVLEEMERLSASDRVRRMGIVVKHRALGFKANAMVVWNIPDDQVDAVAERMAADPAVTLCYQRPRRLPQWPYNLFCMIHGQQRDQVLGRLRQLVEALGLEQFDHQPLFSTRCFKQCGGRYIQRPEQPRPADDSVQTGDLRQLDRVVALRAATLQPQQLPLSSILGAGHG